MIDPLHCPDYRFRLRDFPVGAQMLFVAFGALVLVPLLIGTFSLSAIGLAGLAGVLLNLLLPESRETAEPECATGEDGGV